MAYTKDKGGASGAAKQLYDAMDGWGTDESAIFRALYTKDPSKNKATAREFEKLTDGESLESWLEDEMSGFDLKRAKHLLKYGEMRLSMKILQACAGMGTDEKALIREFKKIQSAKSMVAAKGGGAKAKEADRQRAEVARDEYGSKSAFRSDTSGAFLRWGLAVIEDRSTDLMDELRIYTEGWGTDEAGLFDCVQKWASLAANKGKGQQIAADGKHPVMVELKRELSGEEFLKAKEILLRDGKLGVWRKLKVAAEGWGTDEGALFAALESMTEKDKLELIKDAGSKETVLTLLRDELSGRDLARAEALLDASFVNAVEYDRLRKLVEGTGNAKLVAALKAAREDPGKIGGFKDQVINDLWGKPLAEILDLADKALPGKRILDTKAKLLVAVAGWGSDKEGVYKALASVTPGERQKLSKDAELLRKLKSELPQDWYDIALGMLSQDLYERTSKSLEAGMKGAGTDEDFLFKALAAVPMKERPGIFDRLYRDYALQLRQELNLPMFNAVAEALRSPKDASKLSAEVRLKVATSMRAGTDEAGVTDIISDLKGRELLKWTNWEKVKGKEKASEGEHLQMDPQKKALLDSELSSGDLWDNLDAFRAKLNGDGEALRIIKDDLQARFKGKMPGAKESDVRAEAMNFFQIVKACGDFSHVQEAVQHERSGGASAAIMDTFSSSGYNMEDALSEYEVTLDRALENENLDDKELGELAAAKAEAEARLRDYKAAKAKIASWAATIVSVIVGAIVTVFTAGAGSGLAAMMISAALAAGASAVAGNVTKWLVVGDSMDWEAAGIEIASAVLIGALTGMLSKVVQGVTAGSKFLNVDTFMKQFNVAQKLTWGQFAGKLAVANVQAQIENFVTSMPRAVLAELLKDPENFRSVMLDPLEKLVKPQVEGMGRDALVSLATTTIGELKGGRGGGAAKAPQKSTGRQMADSSVTTLYEGGIELITDEDFIRRGEIDPEDVAKLLVKAAGSGMKAYAKLKGRALRRDKVDAALRQSGVQMTGEELEAYMADQAAFINPPDPAVWRAKRWPVLKVKIREARLEQAKLDQEYLRGERARLESAAGKAAGELTDAEAGLEGLAEGSAAQAKAKARLDKAQVGADAADKAVKDNSGALATAQKKVRFEQGYADALADVEAADKAAKGAEKSFGSAKRRLEEAKASLAYAESSGNVLMILSAKRALAAVEQDLGAIESAYRAAEKKLQGVQVNLDHKEALEAWRDGNRTYNQAVEELQAAKSALAAAKYAAEEAEKKAEASGGKVDEAITEALAKAEEQYRLVEDHRDFAKKYFAAAKAKLLGAKKSAG